MSMSIEAKKLGQLLLMQSVLINLPDKKSIFSFIVRGLSDIPGVAGVSYNESAPESDLAPDNVNLPICLDKKHFGTICLKISDMDLYSPYSDYVKNFVFTVGVILEERHQRQLNLEQQEVLEFKVAERTMQLQNEVNERKSIEEVLRESEERYRLTMLAANDGMFDFHIPKKKVTYSDRWFTMLGYSPDELDSTYDVWKSLLHPDDCDKVEKDMWDNVNSQQRWQIEFRMRAKDGDYHWILARGLCVESDENNTPVRVIGNHTDITYRKNAEEKLREYQNQLESLVAKRTRDLEKKNKDLEEAMIQIQETQGQLILFEKMGALRHLIAGIAHEINNPLGAIESSREIFTICLGSIFDNISKLAFWLEQPNGYLINKMINNCRKSRNTSLLLSTKEKRLRREQYAALFMQNGVSQPDLIARKMVEMNIETDIDEYIPLLVNESAPEILDTVSEFVDSFVAGETIKTAVSRISKIVYALNSYIRKDTDMASGESIRVDIDIRNSLETVLILFQNTIKNYIDLEIDFDKDLPMVYGISDELNQVWTNIIQNAIQSMDGQGKLVIAAKKSKGGIVVSITDQGCGMTKEVVAKIFEPLFTTRPPGEGLGLGMDIVRKIVEEKHSGKIEVESEPGKGTTINVFLPT